MKRFVLILLAALTSALFICGCSRDAGNSGSSATASSSAPSSMSTSAANPSEPDASGLDDDTVHFVQGVIDDMGMGKYYVALEDGRVVAFDCADADQKKLDDARPGSSIVVYYTGVLNGTDTSGLTVVRLESP